MSRYYFILVILLIISACKKEEPEVVTDDPIIGNWRYSGNFAIVDGQEVNADKYSIILYITDSTLKSVTQVVGNLVNDPQIEIRRSIKSLSYYERLPHGVICTIEDYEKDSVNLPSMKGKKLYYVFNFLTLDKMQFVEADECVRLSGPSDSIGSSSFYHLDTIGNGQLSYLHIKYEFSGNSYREYSAESNSPAIPGNDSFNLTTTATVNFSKDIYTIDDGVNRTKVPYFFSGSKLYQKKLTDSYFDNYSWITP